MKKFTLIATLFTAFSLSFTAVAQEDAPFVTKALDDDGAPTFNWEKASGFVPILVSESVSEVLSADLKFDMRPNDVDVFLWVWDQTYVACDDNGGMNSFGELEDHFAMTVSNVGWSGLGIIRTVATDFSFIDDTYVLHIGIKGHPSQSQAFGLGSIPFALGTTAIYDNGNLVKNIGTWPDDGEWYYIDLPIKDLKKLGSELFAEAHGGPTAYTDNFFWVLSGGTQGNEVHIDNVFLYKDSTLEPEPPAFETGDVNRDGRVNVSDVSSLINMILGIETMDEESADVNGDGRVNVSDVTALINIILGITE